MASLYELDTNFKKVISDLKLRLSTNDKDRIRKNMTLVIGRALANNESSQRLNPDGKLQSKPIINSLNAIARSLQDAETKLMGAKTGLRSSHEIEVAVRIIEMLRENPNIEDATKFLSDFCEQAKKVSQACLGAAQLVGSTKSKRGRKAIDWYDDFARILVSIARLNGIWPTVTTDRVTGKPGGRFLDIAAGFEGLLYPQMRSPTLVALAKRLSRSLRRI